MASKALDTRAIKSEGGIPAMAQQFCDLEQVTTS